MFKSPRRSFVHKLLFIIIIILLRSVIYTLDYVRVRAYTVRVYNLSNIMQARVL